MDASELQFGSRNSEGDFRDLGSLGSGLWATGFRLWGFSARSGSRFWLLRFGGLDFRFTGVRFVLELGDSFVPGFCFCALSRNVQCPTMYDVMCFTTP